MLHVLACFLPTQCDSKIPQPICCMKDHTVPVSNQTAFGRRTASPQAHPHLPGLARRASSTRLRRRSGSHLVGPPCLSSRTLVVVCPHCMDEWVICLLAPSHVNVIRLVSAPQMALPLNRPVSTLLCTQYCNQGRKTPTTHATSATTCVGPQAPVWQATSSQLIAIPLPLAYGTASSLSKKEANH